MEKLFLKIPYNSYCMYTLTFQNYFLIFMFLNYRKCTKLISVTRGPEIDYPIDPTDPPTTTDDSGNMAC
jgi:hypothetical protein